jgi:hypothetical protein
LVSSPWRLRERRLSGKPGSIDKAGKDRPRPIAKDVVLRIRRSSDQPPDASLVDGTCGRRNLPKDLFVMLDFWMIAIGVAFFAVMIAYTAACDRL